MDSAGFDATAAKIAAVTERVNLMKDNGNTSGSTLSREDILSATSNSRSLESVAQSTSSVKVTAKSYTGADGLRHEIESYQGYQYDAQKGFGSDAVIYEDKDTPFNEGSDPYNPKYYEVGGVTNKDLTEEENQALVQKIMDNKLDPTGDYGYFKEGESDGSMKLEYGVSPFDWKTMRGLEDTTYDSNDPTRPRYVEHQFGANGSITTKSGKEVSFSMSYTEQLSNGMGIFVKGSQESFADFNARVIKESADLNKSQSDYRTIVFNYESASALSKDETDALNLLAQKMMKTAEEASQGDMTKAGYELANKFKEMEGLFESMEINANYIGAGQNETRMKVNLTNDEVTTSLILNQTREREYNMQRFWNH